MILQTLHVASSSNEDKSSDMESFVFAICFRDLKCAFKLKPYLVSKLHTSQLYLPTALLSTSRWVPDSLLCRSLLCRPNLKKYLIHQCNIQMNSNIFSMITGFPHLLLNQAKKTNNFKKHYVYLDWSLVQNCGQSGQVKISLPILSLGPKFSCLITTAFGAGTRVTTTLLKSNSSSVKMT